MNFFFIPKTYYIAPKNYRYFINGTYILQILYIQYLNTADTVFMVLKYRFVYLKVRNSGIIIKIRKKEYDHNYKKGLRDKNKNKIR